MVLARKLIVHAYLAISGVRGKLRALEELQWLERDQLRALQEKRLRRLLAHASRSVPFYRRMLARTGVADASGEIHLDRFTAIPLLDKPTLRDSFDELMSDDIDSRRRIIVHTGGSTGRPARVVFSDDREVWPTLAMLFDSWAGYHPVDREVTFWGSTHGTSGDSAGRGAFSAKLRRWVNNWSRFDSYRVTPPLLHTYVGKINNIKPEHLYGYADFLYYFARFIEREHLAVHPPDSIIVTATPLHAHMRQTIERVFRAPVLERYGAAEVCHLAAQCEQRTGLHISPTTHFVEVLRQDGTPAAPGELGEVVVTPLFNFAMPLLRYRLEDLGRWASAPCPCGRTWPQLAEVTGRRIDVFVTRGGELVSGGLFIKIVEHVNYDHGDFIEKYQIIQEDLDHVRILLKLFEGDRASAHEAALQEVRDNVAHVVGPGVRLDFEFPADIEPSPSGKYRFTVSKVARSSAQHSDLFET